VIGPLAVRGCAVPFDTVAIVDGGVREQVARDAFSAGVRYVVLRYGGHMGRVIARTPNTLRIWPGATGLAFEASLDAADASAFDAIATGGLGCSVTMRIVSADETVVGHRRIRSAILDDVSLSGDPVYSGTGVWPAGVPIDALPTAAVRRLACAWGFLRSNAASPGGAAGVWAVVIQARPPASAVSK
jgi:hypothetical protein